MREHVSHSVFLNPNSHVRQKVALLPRPRNPNVPLPQYEYVVCDPPQKRGTRQRQPATSRQTAVLVPPLSLVNTGKEELRALAKALAENHGCRCVILEWPGWSGVDQEVKN